MRLRRPTGIGLSLRWTNRPRCLKRRSRVSQDVRGDARRLLEVFGQTTKAGRYRIGGTPHHCMRTEGRAREKLGNRRKKKVDLSRQPKFLRIWVRLLRKSTRSRDNC